ncbi:thioredoxin family protein [bacterium]|nr:thioredoxin family protein [bacterium]
MKKILFLLVLALFSFALSAKEAQKSEVFYFFYSATCPHCHEAMPFVEELEKEYPEIEFRKLELSASPENQAVFKKKLEKLKIKGSGVPTFIFKEKYIVGFRKGVYEEKIRAMIGSPAKKAVPK